MSTGPALGRFTRRPARCSRAQRAGCMRDDVDIDDVMRLVMAYTVVSFASAEQRDRMLGVARACRVAR
jgi:hypothetical protein